MIAIQPTKPQTKPVLHTIFLQELVQYRVTYPLNEISKRAGLSNIAGQIASS
jgi:hypothetical protein